MQVPTYRWDCTSSSSTVPVFGNWQLDATSCGTTTATMWYSDATTDCGTYATATGGWSFCDSSASTIRYNYTDGITYYGNENLFEPSLSSRLKQIIKSRCAPAFVRNRRNLSKPADVREHRARETLRKMIGERDYFRFVRDGFISVKGKSGLIYQIHPGNDFTKVYKQGTLVDRLCVVLSGNFPATDSLVMRYLLILNNEEKFRSLAVKHSVGNVIPTPKIVPQKLKPLPDIFKSLKKVVDKSISY